ncbi:MAG: DUF4270 family protein [Bacteroidales bacterium]|jgi:hypothetical protein|nr:DUF4270 family protein [Bacteroidales bacterium]
MKKLIQTLIITGVIVSLLISFTACETEPSEVGIGLQPGSDKIILATDSLSVFTRTVRDSSVATDERSLSLLGSYVDNDFGQTDASFISQLMLSSGNVSEDATIEVDSVTLVLNYDGYFGDTLADIQFNLYQILDTDFDLDSTYYSDYSVSSTLRQLGTYSFSPRPSDDTIAFTISEPDFLSVFDDNTIYADENTLLSAFKGLYFEVIPSGASGGCIAYFDLLSDNSRMIMHYNDSETYDFLINNNSVRINMFNHDYSLAAPEIQAAINNQTDNQEYAFIQSAAGLKTELRIEDTDKLNAILEKGVNRAQLQVTVASDYFSSSDIPEQLTLVYKNDNDLYEFLTDYKVSSSHFGGEYNEDGSYTFNIPLYLQDLLSGNLSADNYLSLFALNNRTSANYGAIYGGAHPDFPLQIKIITSDF